VDDYVRVVGSLVTDHRHGDYYWKKEWADGKWHTDRNDSARWTEIHSPDTIAPIRQGEPGWRPKVEQYWGVAVVAPRSWPGEHAPDRAITVVLPPPPVRPAGTTRLAVQEMVGAETNIETIVQGNFNRTGALLQVLSNGVQVRITVRGIQWGPKGKFKAIYRVFWA
jgi:hypothetical protein